MSLHTLCRRGQHVDGLACRGVQAYVRCWIPGVCRGVHAPEVTRHLRRRGSSRGQHSNYGASFCGLRRPTGAALCLAQAHSRSPTPTSTSTGNHSIRLGVITRRRTSSEAHGRRDIGANGPGSRLLAVAFDACIVRVTVDLPSRHDDLVDYGKLAV